MLASPMREARTGELPVQTVPTPSKKSIQASHELRGVPVVARVYLRRNRLN